MVTYNKDLLMAFVYFDQSHCGYLLEKDLEEIMYTLGLHLSRAQVHSHTQGLRLHLKSGRITTAVSLNVHNVCVSVSR